jgi:hexosaminidase
MPVKLFKLVVGVLIGLAFSSLTLRAELASPAKKAQAPMSAMPAAPVRLRWEVLRNVFSSEHPQGRSWVVFELSHLSQQDIPATGWSLYFNCVAGVDLKEVQGPYAIEQMAGTLFRLYPKPQTPSAAPQKSVRIEFFHPERMMKMAKGPTGPYWVWDAAPEQGLAITDYQMQLPSQPEQVAGNVQGQSGLLSPLQQYERNAIISDLPVETLPPVFPRPHFAQKLDGFLRWRKMPTIEASVGLKNEAALAQKIIKPHLPGQSAQGVQVIHHTSAADLASASGRLRLRTGVVSGMSSAESYELKVDSQNGITVTGITAAGVARALESLRQLLSIQSDSAGVLHIPAWLLRDTPRFAYRGFQMDVSRNFQPKEKIFQLLDLMARYKLNKFHFHLTDDEGWRLEVPGLKELTQFGARRGHGLLPLPHLPPAYGSGPDVNDWHGSGHYSSADYMAIVQYAAALHIELIPEIEMPGHARAAVKAMQWRFEQKKKAGNPDAARFLLHDLQDKSVYRTAQNYNDNLMDPGLASTYRFIEHVVSHVTALHRQAGVPLRTLHVGGDELPSGAWEQSPATRKLMAKNNWTDMAQVWDYFYSRVDRMLRQRGLVAAGWEELGARKVKLRGADKLIPNPHFTQRGFQLHVWNNLDDAADLAYRLANAGYKSILAPATYLYFDMSHNANPAEPGVNWARYVDLQTVYDFVPFDFIRAAPYDARPVPGFDGLTDFGQANILGLEGTLFSETVRSSQTMDTLLMPRLLALAERAWSPDPDWATLRNPEQARLRHAHGWSVFVNQLGKRVLPQLDRDMPGLSYRIAPPGLRVQDGQVLANHEMPGFVLRYTLDGSEPQPSSPEVSGPIRAQSKVKVSAFSLQGRASSSAQIDMP